MLPARSGSARARSRASALALVSFATQQVDCLRPVLDMAGKNNVVAAVPSTARIGPLTANGTNGNHSGNGHGIFSRALRWLRREPPENVIVLGNQKSGTTVIAALLSQCLGTSVTLDFPAEIRNLLHPRIWAGELDFKEMVRANRKEFSRGVVKDATLSLFFPQTARHFPRSRFVMVMRDPRDNLRSILNRLKLRGDLPDLSPEVMAGMIPAWRLIVDGRWLGLRGENYIERLAARWDLIASTYLTHANRMILIKYDDFVKDKARAIERLARALGREPRHDISDKVDVQYQSRGDRDVKWTEFFGPDNLARIERVCADRMAALGYARDSSRTGDSRSV